ncbi:MAG: SpoIIE family protein phosphatase [Phycisphaerae bacterium]
MSQLLPAIKPTSTDEAELDLARQIQSTFVPGKCYGWPGAQVAARRIPSAGLGGDFHNVIHGPEEQYSIVVGTIAGPGVFAAFAKAVLSGAVREFGPISGSPRVLMEHLDRMLGRINADLPHHRVTCSVFHGLVNRTEGTLECRSAGGCGALAWTHKGELRELKGTGPALGSAASHGYDSESLELASLRRLVVYTAGLTATSSASGESFGAARGRRLLADTVHLPADEQVDVVLRTLRDHVGPDNIFTDDVTVFVTEFSEEATASGADSMRTWFQTYEQAGGAVPDSSVFLG